MVGSKTSKSLTGIETLIVTPYIDDNAVPKHPNPSQGLKHEGLTTGTNRTLFQNIQIPHRD